MENIRRPRHYCLAEQAIFNCLWDDLQKGDIKPANRKYRMALRVLKVIVPETGSVAVTGSSVSAA